MGCGSSKKTDLDKTRQQRKNDPNVEKTEQIKKDVPAKKEIPKNSPIKNDPQPKNDPQQNKDVPAKKQSPKNAPVKNDPPKKSVQPKKVNPSNPKNECTQNNAVIQENNDQNVSRQRYLNQMDVVSKFVNNNPSVTHSKVANLYKYLECKYDINQYNVPIENKA